MAARQGGRSQCGLWPHLALGALPHLYPFIVNDPGEGSQANAGAMRWCWITSPHPGPRRSARRLQKLEGLLDELVEARQLGGERTQVLETQVLSTLQDLDWPGIPSRRELKKNPDRLNSCLDQAETYLCELKESQIRTGLHRYGQCPADAAMTELLMALARPPLQGQPGLTQLMAREAGLEFDPWSQEDGEPLDPADRVRLAALGCQRCRRVGDGSAWLEQQALLILRQLVLHEQAVGLATPFRSLVETSAHLRQRCLELWKRLQGCGEAERQGLMRGLRAAASLLVPLGPPVVADRMCCPPVVIYIPWISVGCRRRRHGTSAAAPPNACWICIFRMKVNPCVTWLCRCGGPPRCAMAVKTSPNCWR